VRQNLARVLLALWAVIWLITGLVTIVTNWAASGIFGRRTQK
jgi:hypothetical protein